MIAWAALRWPPPVSENRNSTCGFGVSGSDIFCMFTAAFLEDRFHPVPEGASLKHDPPFTFHALQPDIRA
jgi:hypothetical protein